MFNPSLLITPLSIFLSISTASGVFIHDTKLDKATLTAIAAPTVLAGGVALALSGELHTHSERNPLGKVSQDSGKNPSIQPRSNKRYIGQKNDPFGHESFDMYRRFV